MSTLSLILAGRQSAAEEGAPAAPLTARSFLESRNLWLLMAQYFASNFTFFFCLSWLFPHLKSRFELGSSEAGFYAAAPFLAGALGHFTAGAIVDRIYRSGHWTLSRRIPAAFGFALAAGGLVASAGANTPAAAVAWLSVAIFGADMTISPSWAVCIDIGRRNAGLVSGTMNMAGNLGSFATSLAFPYLEAWTGSTTLFFFQGAALNILAIGAWMAVRPEKRLGEY